MQLQSNRCVINGDASVLILTPLGACVWGSSTRRSMASMGLVTVWPNMSHGYCCHCSNWSYSPFRCTTAKMFEQLESVLVLIRILPLMHNMIACASLFWNRWRGDLKSSINCTHWPQMGEKSMLCWHVWQMSCKNSFNAFGIESSVTARKMNDIPLFGSVDGMLSNTWVQTSFSHWLPCSVTPCSPYGSVCVC